MPPEEYGLLFKSYGIDTPPAELAVRAHRAFTNIQTEMQAAAAAIAKQRHLATSDYRSVIAALKKEQVLGEAVLPLYQGHLQDIEKLIVAHDLLSLHHRAAIIRLATAAETSANPAPHMQPPPMMHNTGQRGEFVLPLNLPATSLSAAQKYDDFSVEATSWTLIAHEARPGHELQFDAMIEHGVSKARALFAFNSANVEGWGLYAEWIMEPYFAPEAQLMSLDMRLFRAARAFLDPELQAGRSQT